MAVTYVGRSASIVNGNAGQTPALPAGLQVDDILILACETANEAITVTNPNGGTWTEVTNSPQSQGTPAAAGGVRLTVFWSRYNGTQGAPSTSDSGDHQTACIFAFRGCATVGDPWDFTAGNTQAATTSGSVPGGTTTVDGCMILNLVATDRDLASTTTASGHANASLTNLTERADQTFSGAQGGGLIAFTGEKATAGTVNATTWTQAASEELCNLTIALSPGLPPVTGTLASTQADQTAAFAGAEAMTGTMASTQADQTAALSGTVVNAVTGTLAATQDDQTGAFAGAETISGSLAATQDDQTMAASGAHIFVGSLNATQDDQTGAFVGQVANPITGALDALQDDQTGDFAAVIFFSGLLDATQDDQTGDFSGTVTNPSNTGTIAATQQDQAASFIGSVVVEGALSAQQDDQAAAFTGTVTNPSNTGTITAVQNPQTAAFSGQVVVNVTGTMAALQADQMASFTGVASTPGAAPVAAVSSLGRLSARSSVTSRRVASTVGSGRVESSVT